MNLVNLTPHPINVQVTDDPESVVKIEPSGTVARVGTTMEDGVVVIASPDNMFTTKWVPVGDGFVPVHKVSFNAVQGLPSPADNTIYIVSAMVAQQVGPIGAWMSKADDGIEVTVYDASIGQWTRTLTPSFSKAYAMVMDAAHVGVRYLAEKYRDRK